MEHGLHKSLNMELILSIFEQLCGLKITFHKSEVFCMDQAKEIVDQYRTCSVVIMGLFHLDTWESLSTSES
jgi:hypothetical protein